MRTTIYALLCLALTTFLSSCEMHEDSAPCVEARVVSMDPCGGGVVLEIKKDGVSGSTDFCGTPNMFRYVTVDNLPDNLKQEGTEFTCQLKERETDMPHCQAIYTIYEGASIAKICSQPTLLR